MSRFDFGGGIMLGYEFNNRLQINATYKMGFNNLINKPESVSKDDFKNTQRNQCISLGLGYRLSAPHSIK